MSTARWTRCSIPKHATRDGAPLIDIGDAENNTSTVSDRFGAYYTIYGPAQLETYRHSELRKDVKDAKLNVYYPGNWMEPSFRGEFRICLRLSDSKLTAEGRNTATLQWKFRSNAKIVSAHLHCSGINQVLGHHRDSIPLQHTGQNVEMCMMYDHILLLPLDALIGNVAVNGCYSLTLDLDTRQVQMDDPFCPEDTSSTNDELHPPPCISIWTSNSYDSISQDDLEPVSWEWRGEDEAQWKTIHYIWYRQAQCEPSSAASHTNAYWEFPHQIKMHKDETVTPLPNQDFNDFIRIYDFTKEMFGNIKITLYLRSDLEDPNIPLKLWVGETMAEAMNNNDNHCEQSTELRYFKNDNSLVFTSLNLLAFRYARIDIDEVYNDMIRELTLECISSVPPIVMQGYFSSETKTNNKDELIDKIWQTAAYTLQLCTHNNFLVDGIKRDRLPWAGDLAVSIMSSAYSFVDNESIRCTLIVLGRCGIAKLRQVDEADSNDRLLYRRQTSLVRESHVNGIIDFSLWYIICHWLYQKYFRDETFFLQEWPMMRIRISALLKYCTDSETGFLTTVDDDWIFIDWSDSVEKQTTLQILWWWALNCCSLLVDMSVAHTSDDTIEEFRTQIRDVQSRLESTFMRREDIQVSYTRHAHILGVLSGLNNRLVDKAHNDDWWSPVASDQHRQASIKVRKLDNRSRAALLANELDHVGTPFLKHLECLAVCRLGNRSNALEMVRSYWGKMINLGATTFYEAYTEDESPDKIIKFYNRPYARSLCHAWGSGPCALLPEIMLGLRPLNEWSVFLCDPLEACKEITCSVSTKHGLIDIQLTQTTLTVVIPKRTSMILMEQVYDYGTHSIPRNALFSDESVRNWSQKYRDWFHHPKHVIPCNPDIPGYKDIRMTDVPTVYQLPNDSRTYYMSFVGFNGTCYQSFVAESTDLVSWTGYRLAMAAEGEDEGGVVLGAYLYESYNINEPRVLKKVNGMFYSLYGGYSKKGGYEIDPGHQGLASSKDGLFWTREREESILSIFGDVGDWEKSSIYQPWLLEHDGTYYNFYNAKKMPQWVEQIGVATSTDLHEWTRHEDNPILCVSRDGFDKQFCADAKVFFDDEVKHWVMFYFGVGKGGAHIMIAYSKDLLHWKRDPVPLYHAGDNPSGLDKSYAHKISIVRAEDVYYMHYCAVGDEGRGIGLITSSGVC